MTPEDNAEREAMGLRPLHSFENLDQGRYVHDQDKLFAVLRQGGEPLWGVDVEYFMDVQKERDAYRRTLALMNEIVRRSHPDILLLLKLLEDAGFSAGDGRAMAEILEWARSA